MILVAWPPKIYRCALPPARRTARSSHVKSPTISRSSTPSYRRQNEENNNVNGEREISSRNLPARWSNMLAPAAEHEMDRRRFHDFTNSGFTKSYRNIYISIYKSKKYITLFIYQYWIYNRFNFSTNFCSISLCVSNYKNNIYFNIFFVYYIIVSINFLVG